MRQAGRYLPEYQNIRKKHSFLEMCHTPDVAVDVTMTPFKRFDFDAAILFSDILMIPESYGLGLEFKEGVGPVFEKNVVFEELPKLDFKSQFDFIAQAIAQLKGKLDRPLLGFAGAPFTVASYMSERGSSKNYIETKKWMYGKNFHQILDKLTEDTIGYLQVQIDAGVDAVQLFESSLGVLGRSEAQEFSFPYMRRIVEAIKGQVPIMLYAKGSALYVDQLADLKPTGLSVDWQTDLRALRKNYPDLVIQGNLDPTLLFAPLDVLKGRVEALLDEMKDDPAYICNLGHGILPNTPLQAVETLVEAVQCRG
jgi:uroporphyrinogen decarboxylase